MKFLRRLNYILYRFQKTLLVILFSALFLFSSLQVILRIFFNRGFTSADIFTRYMVLWVAFLGAALATFKKRHINLDVVSKQLKKINENLVNLITNSASFIIMVFMSWAGISFIANEISNTTKIFFVPVWIMELIIPMTFIFMGLIFFQRAIEAIACMAPGRKKWYL